MSKHGTDHWANRVAVLGTMHQKETAIAPILAETVGIQVVVPERFDTDRFGTFTRDRDRPGSQLETARQKARAALEQTDCTLGIASEGSFGPHPGLPMLPCDREVVLLLDTAHGLEIVGAALSTQTNYRHAVVQSVAEALRFAETVQFPSHGLVVMPPPSGARTAGEIVKGIVDRETLVAAVETLLGRSPTVHVETDMRALYNPTRMAVIAQATQDLVQRMQQGCPACGLPGFGEVERRSGLPCGVCGTPTALTAAVIWQCPACQFRQEVPGPLAAADPGSCPFCNP
jgi:hypothetical protein